MSKNLSLANALKLEFLYGGYTKVDTRWVCDGLAFHFTRLYYIYSGSAQLFCNGETIIMTPGNLYLLPANLPVSYRCPESMEQLYLHVTLTSPEGFDLLSNIPKICKLPCSQELLEQLKDAIYSRDYHKLLEFKTRVTQTVIDSLRSENIPFSSKSYSKDVLQAISCMQNNLTIQLSSKQIAHMVCTSPSHLYKLFKEETGLTLGAYQDRLIFYHATLLLADRQLSIKEISQQLGFCDQYYFSRRFKAQTGITPSQYRKTIFP